EDSLNTLEKKIDEAKEAMKELPKVKDSMQKMKRILDEIDATLLPEMKKERKMLKAKQNAYDTFDTMEDDLVSHAKKIYELEQNVEKLKVDSSDRLDRIKNPTPKSSSSASARSEEEELNIPADLNVEELEPDMLQGFDNFKDWIKE